MFWGRNQNGVLQSERYNEKPKHVILERSDRIQEVMFATSLSPLIAPSMVGIDWGPIKPSSESKSEVVDLDTSPSKDPQDALSNGKQRTCGHHVDPVLYVSDYCTIHHISTTHYP